MVVEWGSGCGGERGRRNIVFWHPHSELFIAYVKLLARNVTNYLVVLVDYLSCFTLEKIFSFHILCVAGI